MLVLVFQASKNSYLLCYQQCGGSESEPKIIMVPVPYVLDHTQKIHIYTYIFTFQFHFLRYANFNLMLVTSRAVDPDPHGSTFIFPPGSGSAFNMRIRIQEGKFVH